MAAKTKHSEDIVGCLLNGTDELCSINKKHE